MEAKAHLKYLRISPRKVSILCDIIRGKDAKTACVYLMQTPKAASEPMLKLLKSAIANAENNNGMDVDWSLPLLSRTPARSSSAAEPLPEADTAAFSREPRISPSV